jgi:hypothetical protein
MHCMPQEQLRIHEQVYACRNTYLVDEMIVGVRRHRGPLADPFI